MTQSVLDRRPVSRGRRATQSRRSILQRRRGLYRRTWGGSVDRWCVGSGPRRLPAFGGGAHSDLDERGEPLACEVGDRYRHDDQRGDRQAGFRAILTTPAL